MFQVKRRLREAIVYLGGCNCQPRQRNRKETSPSLLGDREGRARPGDSARSHKSLAAVHYTPIGVEPHGPTQGVQPIVAVTNDSQSHLVASSI